MNAINEWVWYRAAYPLAGWLARLGVTKSRWGWLLTYQFSPALAGLSAFISASAKPSNEFYWGWPGPNQDDDLDGLLADVSELIERAPAPGGLDTYWITVERYSPTVEKRYSMGPDEVQRTFHLRKPAARQWVKGDRYYDWKSGGGKIQARELMVWGRPTAELPVTIVRVVVNGDVLATAVRHLRN